MTSKKIKHLIKLSDYKDETYHNFIKHLLEKHRPKSILEVGVWFGSSLFLMAEHCKDTPIIAIDKKIKQSVKLYINRNGVKNITVYEENDIVGLSKHRGEFVHLDADHTFEWMLNELLEIQKWETLPNVVLIHDLICPTVHDAVKKFMEGREDIWNYEEVPEVFNGCMVLTLKKDMNNG